MNAIRSESAYRNYMPITPPESARRALSILPLVHPVPVFERANKDHEWQLGIQKSFIHAHHELSKDRFGIQVQRETHLAQAVAGDDDVLFDIYNGITRLQSWYRYTLTDAGIVTGEVTNVFTDGTERIVTPQPAVIARSLTVLHGLISS